MTDRAMEHLFVAIDQEDPLRIGESGDRPSRHSRKAKARRVEAAGYATLLLPYLLGQVPAPLTALAITAVSTLSQEVSDHGSAREIYGCSVVGSILQPHRPAP